VATPASCRCVLWTPDAAEEAGAGIMRRTRVTARAAPRVKVRPNATSLNPRPSTSLTHNTPQHERRERQPRLTRCDMARNAAQSRWWTSRCFWTAVHWCGAA
jgi:hypothetical protein